MVIGSKTLGLILRLKKMFEIFVCVILSVTFVILLVLANFCVKMANEIKALRLRHEEDYDALEEVLGTVVERKSLLNVPKSDI